MRTTTSWREGIVASSGSISAWQRSDTVDSEFVLQDLNVHLDGARRYTESLARFMSSQALSN